MKEETKDYTLTIVGEQEQKAEEKSFLSYQQLEDAAIKQYDPENRMYTAYLKDESSGSEVGYDNLLTWSKSPQSDLNKTLQIISTCRQYVNFDDIIGLTNECIENNVCTKIRLTFRQPDEKELDKKVIDEIRRLLMDFNEKIGLSAQLARSIPTAWRDGTYIMCLRQKDSKGVMDYVVDYYPLGVAEISSYEVGGQPYVLININELKNRLQKQYPKNKKKKGLFFDNMTEEVKATYPPEVYKAYIDKEQYAKIPIAYSGVLRVNNQNKQYGLSPIFRALHPAMMLETFGNADRSTAKARAKKIIVQFLNKEILGDTFNRDSFAQQAYAHKNLLDAWKQPTVVVTAPATVRAMEYVEPKAETTNINLVNYYRQKEMNTLGISFLANGGAQSLSVANISLKQLMKTINKISRQWEDVLKKWYKMVLQENGYDPALAPDVQVIDAEMMEMDMKKDLVEMLFTKLNCSYETAFELLGINVEDEKTRRSAENKVGMDDVFKPRMTAYTTNGDNQAGRPSNDDENTENKREYDKTRNQVT